MATKWTSPVWRMPENSNQSKLDNYSLDFEGYNWGFIDLGNIVEILPGQPNPSGSQNISNPEWSCSAFVKFGSTAMGSVSMLISTGRGGGSTYWEFRKSASNKIEGYFRTAAGSYTTITGDTTVVSDTWYHVCLTWSSGNLNLYLNGSSDCSAVSATNFYFAGDGFLPLSTIAKFRYTTNAGVNPLNGKLSQLSVFNYGLSETQVKYLFNNNAGGSTPNPQNPMAIAGPTPIAYYPLGGSSTGSSSTLTIPNESGSGDTVFDFNRSDSDYIDLDPGVMKNFTSDNVSISAWVKADAFNAYDYIFVDGATSNNRLVALNYASVRGGLEFTVGNSTVARASGVSINTGEWYHVVCTYAAGGDLKVYLNGNTTPAATATFTGALDLSNHTKSSIGRSNVHSTNYWDGEIYNVQVWNAVLGTSDVTTLYNGGRPYTGTQPQAANLKGWWKMNVDTSFYLTPEPSQTQNLYEAWFLENKAYPASIDKSLLFGLGTDVRYNGFNLSNQPEITYSFWWMNDNSVNSWDLIVGNYHGTHYNLRVYQNRSGAPTVYAGLKTNDGAGGSNTATVYLGNITTPTPGWRLLTFTYDGSTFKGYLNETEIDSASITGSLYDVSSYGTNGEVSIRDSSGSAQGMRISNLVIWNKGLTGPEVSTLYNTGTPLLTKASIPQDSSMLLWNTLENKTETIGGGLYDKSENSVAIRYISQPDNITISTSPVSTQNGISSGMTTANLVTSDLNRSLLYSSYSMDFDGTDYIDCGNISSIPSATELSVSFWANTDSTSQNQVVFGDNSSTPIFSFEYWGSNNRMYFEYGTGTFAYLTLTSVVTAGSWHNVVLVYNGSGASNTDKVKIYVDGVDKSSLLTYTGAIPASLSASIGDFWIGNGQKYNAPFNGKMSNVSVFNKALSQNEILTIYNGGAPNDISSLSPVGWWSLSGDSYFATNWICPDLSANSNNGTGNGLPVTALVGNAPGSTSNGTGTNMAISNDLQGDAPNSDKNAYSVNMVATNRDTSVPSIP